MTVRITVVCLGNICRSPIGEAVLRRELSDLDVAVDSVGTGGWHVGENADPRARAALARAGYHLEHRARKAQAADLAAADLILAMDRSNLSGVHDLIGRADRVLLIRSFDPDADRDEVPDPYYGSDRDFDDVVAMVQATSAGVRHFLKANFIHS